MQHKFIFVFIRYFNAAILSVKSCQKWGRGGRGSKKRWKEEDAYIGGLSMEKGLKPSSNYDAYVITFYKPSYDISCLSKNVAIIIIVSLCSCSNSLSISWLNTSMTSFLSLKLINLQTGKEVFFLKRVLCILVSKVTPSWDKCVLYHFIKSDSLKVCILSVEVKRVSSMNATTVFPLISAPKVY